MGINAHSYFDASATPAGAGSFVLSQISITQSACDGKTVFVTETGYPHAGDTNGGNVPSYANQGIALASIFQATQGYVTFFTFTDGTSNRRLYETNCRWMEITRTTGSRARMGNNGNRI